MNNLNSVRKIDFSKAVKKIVAIAVIVAVGIFLLVQALTFITRVHDSWEEITFAFDKPTLVKTVKTQYQNKLSQLDSSFNQPQQATDTARILKEIDDQLKAGSK